METLVKFFSGESFLYKDCYPSYDNEVKEVYICDLNDGVVEVFPEPELIKEVVMTLHEQ